MKKIAIEMLLTEKKKALSLCVNLAITIFMSTLLLQLLDNSIFKIHYRGIGDLSDDLSIIYFFLILICTCLVAYSSIYYVKIHSREVGLVKLSGFDTFEMIRYLSYQNICIIIAAFIIALILIITLIPIIQLLMYSYLSVKGNIFSISISVFFQCFMIVICEFAVITFLELYFINRTNISEMMEMHNIISYKKNRRKFKVIDIAFLVFYVLGIITMYSGKSLELGTAIVVSILGCVSSFKILNKYIPNIIEKIMDKKKLKALNYVVLGETSLFIQQSMIVLLFSLIITISIPIMIFASINEPIFHIQLIIINFIINVVMYLSIKDRFKLNLQEKRDIYHNIRKIGLIWDEIEVLDRRIELTTFTIFLGITGIYFINLIISSYLQNSLSVILFIILILESFIPALISFILIEKNRREEFGKWKKL